MATYKDVACQAGNPRAVRAVGNALHLNKDTHIPCHRVVRSDGRVGGYNKGSETKKHILQKEGVEIKNGKICLSVFRFLF